MRKEIVYYGLQAEQKQVMGGDARFNYLKEQHEIPDSILRVAAERHIPNGDTSYVVKNNIVFSESGEPALERFNRVRIRNERKTIKRYIEALSHEEWMFMDSILNDPKSDVPIDVNCADVVRVNTQRMYGMEEECAVAVVLAVKEGKDVAKTLDSFFQQDIPLVKYELNVIIYGNGKTTNTTALQVKDFMSRHPEARINVVDLQFEDRDQQEGYAKKLMIDMTLLRAIIRKQYVPLYLVTTDSRTEIPLDPTLISGVENLFDNDSVLDTYSSELKGIDLVAFRNKVHAAIQLLLEGHDIRNSPRYKARAFTSEIYSLVGGYLPDRPGDEDSLFLLASIARGQRDIQANLIPFAYNNYNGSMNPNLSQVVFDRSKASVGTSKPDGYQHPPLQISNQLLENSQAHLNQATEIHDYFSRQNEQYVEEIREIANQVKRPMWKETRVAVCMPVAAHAEADNIRSTLDQYAKQQVDWNQAEINLFVNWPHTADPSEVNRTLEEIRKFQYDNPLVALNVFTKIFHQSEVKYGRIVKYLNDIVLRRIQEAGIGADVMLVTNDADLRGISKKYLATAVSLADMEKVGYLGKMDWGTEYYSQYPGFHASMRFMQYIELFLNYVPDLSLRHTSSSGANFAMKASIFAAVGGYDPNIGCGADTELGKRIQKIRKGDRKAYNLITEHPFGYEGRMWLETNPRRALDCYVRGVPLALMWEQFDRGGYQAVDHTVSGTEAIENDWKSIKDRIEYQINGFIEWWWGYDHPEIYSRSLNWLLGIDGWKQSGKKISITKEGEERLVDNLLIYRDTKKADGKYHNEEGVRAKTQIKTPKLREVDPQMLNEYSFSRSREEDLILCKKLIDEGFAALVYSVENLEQIEREQGPRFMKALGFMPEDYELVTVGRYIFPLIRNWSNIDFS